MLVSYTISVDEKKEKTLLAFLKEMDIALPEKASSGRKKKKVTKAQKEKHLPFFGMCPDWDIDAEELRYGGIAKRTAGW
jgi:hypothetical protein